MRRPLSILVSLVALGSAATAAHALSSRLIREAPEQARRAPVPEDACTPVTSEAFSRIAFRVRHGDASAVGTLRGVLSSPDLPFGDVAGSATVELALVGEVGGVPWVSFSPAVDVVQERGRWVMRHGGVAPGDGVALDTLVIRPSRGGDTASLTVKWEAELTGGLTFPSFDDGTLEIGITLVLHEGSNDCVSNHDLVWAPLIPLQ